MIGNILAFLCCIRFFRFRSVLLIHLIMFTALTFVILTSVIFLNFLVFLSIPAIFITHGSSLHHEIFSIAAHCDNVSITINCVEYVTILG